MTFLLTKTIKKEEKKKQHAELSTTYTLIVEAEKDKF
jgi:hypothetical protein